MNERLPVIAGGLFVILAVLAGLYVWSIPRIQPLPVTALVRVPSEPTPGRMWLGLPLRSGLTFSQALAKWPVPSRAVREAALDHYDLANIRPDRDLQLGFAPGAADPVALRYSIDGESWLVVEQTGEEWVASLEEPKWVEDEAVLSFSLERSLWQDGLEAGLRPMDLVRLAQIFEYELDFNSELKAGAQFAIVAQRLTAQVNGREQSKLGTIHAVRLSNGDQEVTAVHHPVDGEEAWFRADGESMHRPFLRSPLEFSRVTSGFNPKRFHPVLKKRRPHNGTDFGAPTGTPVRAVASGKVVRAGVAGGHGNFVKLDHEGPWETSYSHLSRISVKAGQQVKQGQIIGKVGATGLATGPHLHYQMWKNGQYVDAMRVDLPRSRSLPTKEREAFQQSAAKWVAKLP